MCVYIHADSLTCSPYYLFVPPSFCSADCGSGQGNGKGQVTLLHPLLALPSLQHVCGEERGGRGGRKLSHYNQAAKTELHLRVRVLELTCVYLSVCYQVVIYIFFYFPQRLCFCSIIQTHGWWCVEGGGGDADDSACSCWHVDRGQKGKSDVCAQSNQVKWGWRLLSGRLPIFSIYIVVNIILGKTE